MCLFMHATCIRWKSDVYLSSLLKRTIELLSISRESEDGRGNTYFIYGDVVVTSSIVYYYPLLEAYLSDRLFSLIVCLFVYLFFHSYIYLLFYLLINLIN